MSATLSPYLPTLPRSFPPYAPEGVAAAAATDDDDQFGTPEPRLTATRKATWSGQPAD